MPKLHKRGHNCLVNAPSKTIVAFRQHAAFIMVDEPEAVGLIDELTHIICLFGQAVAQVHTLAWFDAYCRVSNLFIRLVLCAYAYFAIG